MVVSALRQKGMFTRPPRPAARPRLSVIEPDHALSSLPRAHLLAGALRVQPDRLTKITAR